LKEKAKYKKIKYRKRISLYNKPKRFVIIGIFSAIINGLLNPLLGFLIGDFIFALLSSDKD
jgi:hypothetical protein